MAHETLLDLEQSRPQLAAFTGRENSTWLCKLQIGKDTFSWRPNYKAELTRSQQCAEWIDKVKARREKGITQTEDGRDTVFDLLLEPNPDRGYEVPTIEQLVDEAFLLLVAGSDTTAYSIACTTFYLLNQKKALTKLKQELRLLPRTMDGRLDLANVMGLPYLVLSSSSFSSKSSSPKSSLHDD